MKRYLVGILLVGALGFVYALPPVRAAGSISVSPFYQDIVVTGNKTSQEFAVQVANRTTSHQSLHIKAVDAVGLDQGGGLLFEGAPANSLGEQYNLASWIDMGKDVLELEPGEAATVKGQVVNKASLSPGGHYGALLIYPENLESALNGNKVTVKQVLSSLLFVQKPDGATYDMKANDVAVPSTVLRLPDQIQIRFRNDGNIHVTPRGVVKVYDPRGTQVLQGVVNDVSRTLLPGVSQSVPAPLHVVGSAWLPGKYRMQVQYRYEGAEQFVTLERSFWYIGWPIVITVLAGLALYGLSRKSMQAKRKRRRLQDISSEKPDMQEPPKKPRKRNIRLGLWIGLFMLAGASRAHAASGPVDVSANVPALPAFVFAVQKNSQVKVVPPRTEVKTARQVAVRVRLQGPYDRPIGMYAGYVDIFGDTGELLDRSSYVTDVSGDAEVPLQLPRSYAGRALIRTMVQLNGTEVMLNKLLELKVPSTADSSDAHNGPFSSTSKTATVAEKYNTTQPLWHGSPDGIMDVGHEYAIAPEIKPEETTGVAWFSDARDGPPGARGPDQRGDGHQPYHQLPREGRQP